MAQKKSTNKNPPWVWGPQNAYYVEIEGGRQRLYWRYVEKNT